ncbi:hypothetical protein [Thiothrix sp.]|jgi:hypothetical protein|uniref:hypothetical protein n=1 Tax=Thiothrix sp. TaxID=1032 RepID=UPI002580F210|nr:hypothetical protein [Thiothrix sp.]
MIGGIFFIVLSYSIVFFIKKNNAPVFFLAITTHLTLGLINIALNGQMPGADADAQTFFLKMSSVATDLSSLNFEYPDILNGSLFFINVYGLVQYFFGGSSFFLAHMISIFGSSLCLLLIYKICLLIGITNRKNIRLIVFIYTLAPGILLYQSYILREVWQSLFILILVWCGIYWKTHGFRPILIPLIVFSYFIGMLFHHSLMYTLLLVTMEVVLLGLGRLKVPTSRSLSTYITLIIAFGLFFLLISMSNTPQEANIIDSAGNFIEGASGSIEDARSNYGVTFSTNQPWTILTSLTYYQLMPFPHKISSFIDLISVYENLLRLYLIWIWWKNRKKLSTSDKNIVDGLIIIWISIEAIWSIGTFNWGTAARHHVPAMALLVIAALSSKFLSKSVKNMKG